MSTERPITVDEILPFVQTERGRIEIQGAVSAFKVAALEQTIRTLQEGQREGAGGQDGDDGSTR